jgi:sterol desaturase/sphingolipid hydroxylase (fatty acid hydroxylase superfamily)
MNHRVPALWRSHVVHHADLDLDASTALRFHFGELAASLPLRAVQVLGLGTSPLAFSAWQTFFGLSILFHHSGVELPLSWERPLLYLVVTPRMHGIHHSIVPRETESNWSSGLSWWDHLHGTIRVNVPQAEVTIGVPALRTPEQVTLPKMVALPFRSQQPQWVLPGGEEPQRAPQPGCACELQA